MKLLLGILLGVFFGFALYHAQAAKPQKIYGMLQLKDLELMKIIFFAIGFGSVLLAISAKTELLNLEHLSVKTMHLGVIIGGLIFGIGFGLGGTCPGTCVTAIGTKGGAKRGLSVVLGGISGAFVFLCCKNMLTALGLFDTWNIGKITLFHISDTYVSLLPFRYGGLLIMGLLFMVIAWILPENQSAKERSFS